MGFDGITSLLGLFADPSSGFVWTMGFIFAALAIPMYFGFDLSKISKKLNISLIKIGELKYFLDQHHAIQEAAKNILELSLKNPGDINKNSQRLNALREQAKLLNTIFNNLAPKRLYIENKFKTDSLPVSSFKWTVTIVAGTVFTSCGFFTGQAVVHWMSGLSLSAAMANPLTFALILGLGTLCAIAAFNSYRYLEAVGIKRLADRLHGKDPKMYEEFISKENAKALEEEVSLAVKSVERGIENAELQEKGFNKTCTPTSADDLTKSMPMLRKSVSLPNLRKPEMLSDSKDQVTEKFTN